MGDSGEGLIDAEGRIQERMEELARDRELKKGRVVRDPAGQRALESLKLARTELERQLKGAANAGRKAQISMALEDVNRRMAETSARLIP